VLVRLQPKPHARRKAANTASLKLTVKKLVLRYVVVKASVNLVRCNKASTSLFRQLTVTLSSAKL
jgi:hypothetical protein